MIELRGGMRTFYENFSNHPKSKALFEISQLYLSSKKKPIGSGKNSFIRIDGVYFHKFFENEPLNQKLNYLLFNKNILTNYNKCKKVIFQSKFSKNSFLRVLNPNVIKDSTIIYNGSKEIAQYPKIYNETMPLKIVTCSVDHPSKRLHYFFELEKQLKKDNINFEILIITSSINFKQRIFAKMRNFKNFKNNSTNIRIEENLTKNELYKELLSSHLYVSFSHIDPCPNSIIEAISVGLPVVAPKSGSMPELCLPDLLYKKNIQSNYIDFFNYEPINNDEVKLVLKEIIKFIEKKEYFYDRSLNYKSTFTLDKMIDSYVNYMT